MKKAKQYNFKKGIDNKIFADLVNSIGDKHKALIFSYIENSDQIIKDIEAHLVNKKNHKKLSAECHKLKSSTALVGANKLYKRLDRLEALIVNEKEIKDIDNRINSIVLDYSVIKDELQAYLNADN